MITHFSLASPAAFKHHLDNSLAHAFSVGLQAEQAGKRACITVKYNKENSFLQLHGMQLTKFSLSHPREE